MRIHEAYDYLHNRSFDYKKAVSDMKSYLQQNKPVKAFYMPISMEIAASRTIFLSQKNSFIEKISAPPTPSFIRRICTQKLGDVV